MLNGKRKSSTAVVGTRLLFCISGDWRSSRQQASTEKQKEPTQT
jgi:hypothetical protein